MNLPLRTVAAWVLLLACESVAARATTSKRVLMIGVDGAGGQYVQAAATPQIDALVAAGTARFDFLNEGGLVPNPPEPYGASGVNWSTIVTGTSAARHGVRDNSFAGNSLQQAPHWFQLAKQHDPGLFTASIVAWAPINDQLLPDQFADVELSFPGLSSAQADVQVRNAAVQLLGSGDPDAVFLHFDQVDAAGHASGWGSVSHLAAIQTVDQYVGNLMSVLRQRPGVLAGHEDWLVLISADHGASPGATSHFASQGPDNWKVPMILSGPSALQGVALPQGTLRDMAATALWHLGVDPFATPVEGRVIGLAVGPANGILADLNQDGIVGGDGSGPPATDDVAAFVQGWFTTGHASTAAALAAGDLNLDRVTDLADWLILRRAHPELASAAWRALTIPEPAAWLLGLLASLLWPARGRGRQRPPRSLPVAAAQRVAPAGLRPAPRRVDRAERGLAVALAAAAAWLAGAPAAAAQVVLFEETFESVILRPNVDETVASATAWTDVPPPGWLVDDSGVPSVGNPAVGVTEWEGWSFAAKSWWVAAAQDQQRSQFAAGQGVVAVADPDEWDDRGAPVSSLGYYNARMTTPAIALGNYAPETIRLRFDSSWRDECCDDGPSRTNDQTAVVRALYDTGEVREILRWESAPDSPFFKNDAVNETVSLSVSPPAAATSVRLQFGLLDAGNDWWWAIDNVRLEAVPDARLRLVVDRDTGRLTLRNLTGTAQSVAGYQIVSAAGALQPAGWTPVSGRLDGRGDGSLDPDRWLVASRPGDRTNLSEIALDAATLPAGATVSLGPGAWGPYHQTLGDLRFEYADAAADAVVEGVVQFIGNEGVDFPFGDLDFDGDLDSEDWLRLRTFFTASLGGLTRAERYRRGDLSGDGRHGLDDIVAFQTAYDAAHGAGAFAAATRSVPEPAAALLLAAGAAGSIAAGNLGARRRSPRGRRRPLGLTLGVGLCAAAVDARAATFFFENFDGLPLGPPVQESLAGSQVWTKSPPAGWSIDDSAMPAGGMAEWRGWSFADPQWWANAAQDQGRGGFTRSSGAAAIADPDEWLDAAANPGTFQSRLITPAISLPAGAGSLARLRFDSSWRPEASQRASVAASFDGGPFAEVLVLSSQPGDPDYRPDATNENVVVDLDGPPGATTLQLQFELRDAGNNWWWAIDNLEVFSPLTVTVDASTGAMHLVGSETGVRGYEILSPAGALRGSTWQTANLTAQLYGSAKPAASDFDNDLDVDAADRRRWEAAFSSSAEGDADGDGRSGGLDLLRWQREAGLRADAASVWTTFLAANTHVAEAYLAGASPINGAIPLGSSYDPAVGARDLVLRYVDAQGDLLEGRVAYLGGAGAVGVPEPTTLASLLAAGGGAAAGIRSRRAERTAARRAATPPR